jgi:hypothetical protein
MAKDCTNPMLAAALSYARRGWQIFPATRWKTGYSIEKRGIDTGTPWGRTSDPEIIRHYWNRIPNANIGLAMGAISGVFDIEVDTREGHHNLEQEGDASLAALEAQHGALPPTLMFVSPSGSVHRLFRHPGDDFQVEHSTSKLGVGIDVIGDRFMSVVPPSRKPGNGVYSWLNDLPVAAAPDWLIERVRKPAPVSRLESDDDAELPPRELVELVLALLPNDDPNPNYLFWKDVGMAIYASTGGAGYDLFVAWSRKFHGFDADTTQEAWQQIESCPPDRYGPRAIINKLAEVVPFWETAAMNPAYNAQIDEFNKLLDEAA